MTTDDATLGTIAWYPQHPRWPGLRAHVVHPGGTDWRLGPNDTDREQDHQPGLCLQQAGICRGVLADDHNGSGRHAVGSVPGCPGPTTGLERRVNALPQAKCGELRGHH